MRPWRGVVMLRRDRRALRAWVLRVISAGHGGYACSRRVSRVAAVMLIAPMLAGGCTRIELENKAEAYNAAISEANNEAILLNAVRASQRAPMSFVGLGEVQASPNLSADITGTFNWERVTGITTWSATPTARTTGGFSQFSMTNLNRDKFMEGIRKPVSRKLIKFFEDLDWPKELVHLMTVQAYTINHQQYLSIVRRALQKCDTHFDTRTQEICKYVRQDYDKLQEAGCREYESRELLNTGRDVCGMATFQLFQRSLRVLNLEGRLPYKTKSAQGMLYYLGELIAAQNYSPKPYIPMTLVGTSEGRRLVPFFEVRRGIAAPGEAAVHVHYRGEPFFIPRPALGTLDEARSLQVLDFVSQVITAQTTAGDIPRSNVIGIVAAR
jgi:hypothetical protein